MSTKKKTTFRASCSRDFAFPDGPNMIRLRKIWPNLACGPVFGLNNSSCVFVVTNNSRARAHAPSLLKTTPARASRRQHRGGEEAHQHSGQLSGSAGR